MSNHNRPTTAFPTLDTEEGRNFQDKLIDARMRQTVLRQWLRDEVSGWSDQEIQDYINDETKPFIRRNFLKVVVTSTKDKTQMELMSQLDGKPKQEIETTLSTATPISLEMFGDSAPKEN